MRLVFGDHTQGGAQGHQDENPFEEILGDFFEKRATEPKSKEDSWEQEGVEEKGFAVEEAELVAEGDFGDIDGEIEPGARADHNHFGGALGKEVEGGDGSGGVGDHGGDASGPTAKKAEEWVVSDESEELRARALDEDDENEDDDDPAERMAEEFGGDAGHNPPTGHDACEGGGKESAEGGPGCVFVEGADG